jgi:cytochrome P450
MLQMQRDQLAFVECMQRTYGDMATIHIGPRKMVFLFRPEYVRYVLTESPRSFTTLQSAGGDLAEVLGEGLLTIEGETHRQQRRLVQPAFHRKRVESYGDVMVQYAREMVDTWHAGEEIDIASEMQQLTLRIVARTLFALEVLSQIDELGQHFNDVVRHRRGTLARLLNLYIDLPFTGYGKRMAAKHRIESFVYSLIEQRRAEGRDAGDVLSMLLSAQDEGLTLSASQIRDHVMTFVAAGHETTANALTWTFYLLSQNPQAREKLLNELRTVLAGRLPTVDDLPNLPYTEWVINESMRVYPPVWMMGRRASVDVELGGYHFPSGTSFLLCQWVLHRHPDIWHDPLTFRPERWKPEQGEKVPTWAYFPFGGGPRICIGMPFAQLEAKLLLITILQRYTPRLVPGFAVKLQPRVTLRPKDGLRMILEYTPTTVKDTVEI